MGNKHNKKRARVNPHLWRITAILVACSILYYFPVLAGVAGWTALHDTLGKLHNLYGIDFYGIMFFAPVVYTAYVLGIKWTLIIAFISTALVLPYSILIDTYPNVLFKPAAFAIILSAVGSVVAMLQKGDEQRHRSVRELKCLYDVGKAAEESDSIERFLSSVVELISHAIGYPQEANVRIVMRDRVFQNSAFEESSGKITEDLTVGGEVLGHIEIHSSRSSPYLEKHDHMVKTLAERIGGAIREIELEGSLQGYYGQLEEEVERRTGDLERIQEKLIRSERLAAVGELASGVGHELRNPLNVIRNCVYLLNLSLADKDEEDTIKTLKLLDKQIDISNKIVTDLLDFTRVKPPAKAEAELNSLIRESLSWVKVPKGVKVTANLNGNSLKVKIDAEQVGRAFTNIISNAIQAIHGKGELTIDTGVEDGLAWAKFTDNGCGIPEENLEKIFEPLYTTKPKGIGLGLAITKRVIEENGGRIEVASQVDKGTAFTIRLPL